MRAQAERLLALGARAVLIKGGHGDGAESVDLLVEPTAFTRLAAPRIATAQHPRHRLHAVVGDRGRPRQGPALAEAAREAKAYVTAAIAAADRLDRLGPRARAPFPRLVVTLPGRVLVQASHEAHAHFLNFTIFCRCSPSPSMPSVTTSPALSHTGRLHAERRRRAACRW